MRLVFLLRIYARKFPVTSPAAAAAAAAAIYFLTEGKGAPKDRRDRRTA
jgi:hypothetical protein